jgi:hypothetical protein
VWREVPVATALVVDETVQELPFSPRRPVAVASSTTG